MDKEKAREALTTLLIDKGVFNNLVCRQDYAYPDDMIYECCRQVADIVIDAGNGNIN